MPFGQAIILMMVGKKVQREEWSGKGMFLFTIAGDSWSFATDADGIEDLETLSFICMKTADDKLVPWLASQTDLLAYDWQECID